MLPRPLLVVVVVVVALSPVPAVRGEVATSCTAAIQDFLSRVSPKFDDTDKSLSLELVEISDFYQECGTMYVSVELWRVISKPKIERPSDFGTPEYFSKDQHCENPNPDLLAKHGQARKAWAWQPRVELKSGSGSEG